MEARFVRPLQVRPDLKWVRAGALIVAPMLFVILAPIPYGAIRLLPTRWHDMISGLPIIATVVYDLFVLAICALIVWQGIIAVRFVILEMRTDQRQAYALIGIGFLSASFAAFYFPSLVANPYDPRTIFSFGVVWLPAGVLGLAGVAAFVRARSAWSALCFLPYVPLVAASIHENVWFPHHNYCPEFWLKVVQGPWVLVGFFAASTGLCAIFALAWRRNALGQKAPLIVFAIEVTVMLLLGLAIYEQSQAVMITDCGAYFKNLRHLVGPFYW